MDFISTCPFLEKYNISLDPIGTQAMITERPDGSALDYNGSSMVDDKRDALGNRKFTRRASFTLWLRRAARHEVQRQEIADFLFNFEQWVEYQQVLQRCPKLSVREQDKEYETMWADDGLYVSKWEDGSEANLYAIQLHVEYFNTYLKKEIT